MLKPPSASSTGGPQLRRVPIVARSRRYVTAWRYVLENCPSSASCTMAAVWANTISHPIVSHDGRLIVAIGPPIAKRRARDNNVTFSSNVLRRSRLFSRRPDSRRFHRIRNLRPSPRPEQAVRAPEGDDGCGDWQEPFEDAVGGALEDARLGDVGRQAIRADHDFAFVAQEFVLVADEESQAGAAEHRFRMLLDELGHAL